MTLPQAIESKTDYEFEPFDFIFLRRREEILKLVGLASYALRSMSGLERLTAALKKPIAEVEKAREIETLAKEEAAADFPILHSAAAVLIWGALEAAFRDFLVRWLACYPACLLVNLNSGDSVIVNHTALERYVQVASHYAAAIVESAMVVAKAMAQGSPAAQPSIPADRRDLPAAE